MSNPKAAVVAFAAAIRSRFDEACPATQDAIDRIVAGECFRGREGMIEALHAPHYRREDFVSALLSAWKPQDIYRATGRTLDEWLAFLARTREVLTGDLRVY